MAVLLWLESTGMGTFVRESQSLLGYPTYELTSSPVHSSTIPGFPRLVPNSRRLAGVGNQNYLFVRSLGSRGGAKFRVLSRSAGGLINFDYLLRV